VRPRDVTNREAEVNEQQQIKRDPEPARPLRSVAYGAKKLDCTPDTVYNLIARGDIRAVRVGRHLKIADQELDKFIERGGCAE
jgi:excisionase family DNA binding protein